MPLDKNSQYPLYRQLMDEIKILINTGKYKAGDQIPTEPELAKQYNVSRITIRKTIDELCMRGYLIKCQGKGTFVEAPKIYRKVEQESNMSFTDACRMNGRKPTSHVLYCKLVEPEAWNNEFLQLPKGEMLYHVQRVLYADELPIIYEHIYLPYRNFPDFQAEKLENGSLFRLLEEEYHVNHDYKNRSTIEVATADQDIAEELQILIGEPVMLLSNYLRNEENQPVYMSSEIIVGSRYRISI